MVAVLLRLPKSTAFPNVDIVTKSIVSVLLPLGPAEKNIPLVALPAPAGAYDTYVLSPKSAEFP